MKDSVKKNQLQGVTELNDLLSDYVQQINVLVVWTLMFIGEHQDESSTGEDSGLSFPLKHSVIKAVRSILEGTIKLTEEIDCSLSLTSIARGGSPETNHLTVANCVGVVQNQCENLTDKSKTPISNKIHYRRSIMKSIQSTNDTIQEFTNIGNVIYLKDINVVSDKEYYEAVTNDEFYDLIAFHKSAITACEMEGGDLEGIDQTTRAAIYFKVSESLCKTDSNVLVSSLELIKYVALRGLAFSLKVVDLAGNNLTAETGKCYMSLIDDICNLSRPIINEVTEIGALLYPESLDVGDDEKGLGCKITGLCIVLGRLFDVIRDGKGELLDEEKRFELDEMVGLAKTLEEKVQSDIVKSRELQDEWS